MTEHEKLMENYEDALLRLLMESAARSEGQELLKQLGPVSQSLERDALDAGLRRHYRRMRTRRLARAVGNLLCQTAVFAVVAVLVFTTAMAASGQLRATLRLSGRPAVDTSVPARAPEFSASWLPWGFELKFSDDGPTQYRRYYANASGGFLDISCLYLDDGELEVDASAGEVQEVQINGRPAILLPQEGCLQLVEQVKEQGCVILLLSAGVSQEDLLHTAQRLILPWN